MVRRGASGRRAVCFLWLVGGVYGNKLGEVGLFTGSGAGLPRRVQPMQLGKVGVFVESEEGHPFQVQPIVFIVSEQTPNMHFRLTHGL